MAVSDKSLKDNTMGSTLRRRIEAVVFDMDGVLIDSEPVHYESTRILFEEMGETLRETVNNEFLGSTDRFMFEVLRERYGLSPTVDELIERRKAIYMDILQADGLPWREGIRELIADLAKEGFRLAVASSGLKHIIMHTLEDGGIDHLFAAVVSGDEITQPKPAPDIYLEAVRRLRIEPSHCAAIEDTDVGVRAAKTAGMFTIAFPNATTSAMDFTPADAVITESRQVLPLFNRD